MKHSMSALVTLEFKDKLQVIGYEFSFFINIMRLKLNVNKIKRFGRLKMKLSEG